MEKSSKNNTDGSGIYTKRRGESDNTKDGTQVIKKRSNGGNEETFAGLENTSEKSGNGKKELSNRHEADKIAHELELGRRIVGDERGKRVSKDNNESNNKRKNETKTGESGVGHTVSFLFRFNDVVLINRNKSSGKSTNDQELKDCVGNDKGGEVNIEIGFETTKEMRSKKAITN